MKDEASSDELGEERSFEDAHLKGLLIGKKVAVTG